MDLGRFLVEAVVLGGAKPSELIRAHPISESWLFRLLARYRAGGPEALQPRSRRPKSSPRQTPVEIRQAIIELRTELVATGLDAGAQTREARCRRQRGVNSRGDPGPGRFRGRLHPIFSMTTADD